MHSDRIGGLAPLRRVAALFLLIQFISLQQKSIQATILNVGYGRTYGSITQALSAAQMGDEILLDPNFTPQLVKFPDNFIPSAITIRGHNESVASISCIQSVDIGSQYTLGNISFIDLTFTGSEATYSYQEAIITSSSSPSSFPSARALSFTRCSFNLSPELRNPPTTVVSLPIINQALSFDACYCNSVAYLIAPPSSSRGFTGNFDSRVQEFSVTNSAFPSSRCAIHLPATRRLVRDAATIAGNFMHSARPEATYSSRSARLCHSFQGFKRVDVVSNNFVRDASVAQDWPSEFCMHLTGSRFVISGNNFSSVSWIRISQDASITMGNNSLAPIYSSGVMADFPTISPDLDCSKTALNLRQNWWGFADGPRLTQYNGTWRETYSPWYLSEEQNILSVPCPDSCAFSCDYTTGKCRPAQLDQLTVIGISLTTSLAASFIALVLLFPYCRFYCCRPGEYA
eukprot:TRINITY_DN11690_c0_g1_i1.p1 TRINITY_DN11690_c0_g1~~TRINITY_DN11690_c0_g1_i1.p1  ORF type:complete len:458 (+),score=47.64 TRINITY_DN11690_c0_g1_i1:38-1411(+)